MSKTILLFLYILSSILASVISAEARADEASSVKKLDLYPHLDYNKSPSNEKLLEKDYVTTRETIVVTNGMKYRQIEYQGKYFLVDMREPERFGSCKNTPFLNEPAVEGQLITGHRSKVFIETLMQECDLQKDRIVTDANPLNGNVGVKIRGEKPGDGEKKIYVNPMQKLGGVGTTF